MARKEIFYDKRTQKLYTFLKNKKYIIYDWTFERLLKNNELGMNVLDEFSDICIFEDMNEAQKFLDLYMDWYNNTPQYVLCGYSPIEFRKMYK